MMFGFFRPTIGLEFGLKTVRAARAKQEKGALTLLEHSEKPKDGLPLRPLLDDLHISPKKAVILIPAHEAYTHLFTFPLAAKKDLQSHIRDEVARTIPEDPKNLTVRSKILQQSKEAILVGIAAARTDVIHTYTDTCVAARLRPIAVTTAPCIIASTLQKQPSSFVLIHATEASITATLFYQSWPIDEEIFPEGTPIETVMQAARDLKEEYRGGGIVTDNIFVCGSQAKEEIAPTASGKSKSRTKKSTEALREQSLPYPEEVLPTWRDKAEWIAPAYASITRVGDVAVNFAA